jgi:hypothetical protein
LDFVPSNFGRSHFLCRQSFLAGSDDHDWLFTQIVVEINEGSAAAGGFDDVAFGFVASVIWFSQSSRRVLQRRRS